MDKETLLKEGLTEEQANKILALYSKREKEHSKAIEEKDSEITRLKAESKANAEKYSQDLKKLNIDSQIELALTKAGSKNNKAVKALLTEYLEKAELDDKGKLKGLDKEIKALQTSDDYLFGGTTTATPKTKSYVPESSSSDIIETHFTKDNFDLTKLGKIYKENPSQAKALAEQVGLNLF
jgi:hypothetical protein